MLQALEMCVTAIDGGKAVGLVDGDDAQPGEDRVAVGLDAQEIGPGCLAGVFDELARRAHDLRDRAVEVVDGGGGRADPRRRAAPAVLRSMWVRSGAA